MLKKLQKPNSEGFTIIEVMIVLAIAALILLIVLLAVPALQRNSRNTAIKNDASSIVAAVGEFSSNNDGAIPSGSNQSGSTVNLTGASGDTPATAKVQSNTTVQNGTAPDGPGIIDIEFQKKCSADNGFATTDSPRSTAVLYYIETSNDKAPQCVDS
ncbi:MAG TPA: prepilin-type N-terminal cleavage/methylation domain-containing protein [Candidatus Saccharimonadales bacterium]|nr:prepilin-type N-terminal cleavage/methylation domain-containing protein [Candidatus Saccharimonadales bacterium]